MFIPAADPALSALAADIKRDLGLERARRAFDTAGWGYPNCIRKPGEPPAPPPFQPAPADAIVTI